MRASLIGDCTQVRCGSPWAAILLALAIGSLPILSVNAVAQETRADVIRQEQSERQKALVPESPNAAERIFDKLEDWGLGDTPRGPYPWLGSVYPGGGFAAGAGLRKPFADDGAFNIFGGYSIESFARAQADLSLPTFARNRARFTFSGRYIDAPDVRYFGVGNDSSQEDLTRFGYNPIGAGARLDIQGRVVSFNGGVELLEIGTSGGRTGPSIEDRFSPTDTPGLGVSTFNYVNSRAQLAIDWRKPLGYSAAVGCTGFNSTTIASSMRICTRSSRLRPKCCS